MTKTHTMRSRLISLVLVLVMVLGYLPLSALAADPTGLESEFQSNSVTYGDFTVSTRVADGYQLQTVGSQDSKQNVGMRMQIYYRDTATTIADGKLRIELYDEKGDCFRVVDVSGINYPDSMSGFSANTTATSYAVSLDDTGKRVYTPDSSAWAPKVTYNSDSIFVTGILVELTGSGSFPLKAKIIDLGNSGVNVGDGNIQVLGNFDIKAYSVDVPTVNLTYNLDATDAYYAYSTVAIQKGEEYPLPTVEPIREHYTFKGWKLDGTTYQPGAEIPYTLTSTDLMLTAVWERDTLDVLFDSVMATGVTLEQAMTFTLNGEPVAYQITEVVDSRYLKVNMPYGTDVTFKLKLAAGYDPSTLAVVAGETLLAPINTQANDDGTTTYTYTFKATQAMTVGVRDDLTKYSYVVTMPVGHFTAKLTGNGITSETSTTVEYGDDYSFTVTPEEGYEIVGVYVNGDELTANAGVYTVKDVKTAQNVEVLVKEIPNYTVTYVVNNTQYATQVVAKGSEITNMPKSPDVTGYDFEGWYTQGLTGGEGDKILTTTTVNGDMIVYAKLTAKTYTISYNGNGVTIDPSISSEKTYGEPVKLDATVLTRDGYTFLGWSRNQKATEATYAAGDVFTEEITEDITLYAVWKANTYTVTLPTGTGYTVVTTKENVVNWNGSFTFDVVVDRGYVETAPVVKANDAPLTATSSAENPDGSKTYSYTIENIQENQVVSITVGKNKTYTVDFQVQGASYLTQEVEYGYCATVPAAPVVEGYTFRGWTTDEANEYPYDFTTPVTEDLTLYAHLEKITYTVKLPTDADGYDENPNGDQTVDWNGSQEFTVTVKEGYSDANMVVSANGTPLYPIEKNDSTYTYKIFNIKADQAVYVVGVERKTVTITYNDNGGVGGPTQQVANYYVATASDNSEVSAIEPTRDGYVFQGWAKTNTATANDVVYKHGVDDKDTLKETTDTTLYAVWARAESKVELEVEPDEQFEGSEVTLTATVSSGGTGSVLFYRSTDDANSTADDDTLVGTSDVSGDKATATVAVKDYVAGNATDRFYAVFKPTDGAGYQESTSATVGITVRSTAITWGVDAGKAQSKLEIAGETDGNDNMIAGQQYTLTIPSVYALDDDTTPVTDYTVTWEKKTADGDWAQIANADGASYIVTAYNEGDQYRAKLTPTDPYNKAVNDPAKVSYTATLVTGETDEAVKQATEIALTVTDTHDYTTGDDGTKVVAEFEGQDVTLTASVTYYQATTPIKEGSVQFYLNDVEIGQPVAVNAESGKAVLTWTTSAYDKAGLNTDAYTAKYLGTATYAESNTAAAETVTVRSTAISWKLDDNSIADGANQLTIKEGTDEVEQMVAGHTYTLELPDVYALDNMNDEVSEYTVTWQKKDAQQDWVTVADAGDTYTVTSYKVGDEYRAVVTPADPYTKAQGYNTDGTLADGYVKTLIAGTGVTVKLQPTATTLAVSDTNDVEDTVAEFEGQKVTLTATVVDQSTGKPVTTGFVQFYKAGKNDGNATPIGEPVAVNGNNGTAVIEATMSEYEVNTSDEFYAVYQANETYDTSTSVSKSVLIRSTAIAWTADGNALNVYTGDSTHEDDLISDEADYYLYANRTYTLQLPAVQEDGQDSVTLKNDVDYTVTWYEIDGSGNATIIPTASGDTCVVTPSEDNMQYFAVVYPKTGSNYTDAYENSAYTTHLTTAQTGNSQRATTVTTLDITNVIERTAGSEPLYEQYEGIEITLTANVKVEDPANAGVGLASPVISQGTVTFYVIMSEDVDAGTATPKQIAKVDVSNGMAQTTYVLPECTLADALDDIEYFYAVYQDSSDNAQGTVTYQSSNSTDDAGEMDITKIVTSDIPADDQVQILSTAISWALNNDVITADGNTIAIYEGDGTTTPLTGNMVATETYTLALPAVYAYNDADDADLTGKALEVNVDYHVDWQYLDNGMSDWTTLGAASQDTYLITSHVEGRVYRAVVTPIYDQSNVTQYKTAAKYDEDDKVQNLHFTELYTDPTAPTDLKDTTTDLAITGTDHEPAEVWINGSTQEFKEEHYTQFAGQTVTLKATVTEAGSDVLVGTGKVYFYRYVDGINDVKLNDTAVDVNNGIAEYTVTISDYNAKNSVTANVDKFYAVYETNNTYKTSASTAVDEGVYAAPTELTDLVYIKSTIIDIPVIISKNAGANGATETTKSDDLTGLQSGIKHTFTLKDSAGTADATADYSVVALDGRVVNPANYTFEWFTNTGTGEEEITSAATKELLTDITKVDDTFHIHLVAKGDMTGGLRQDGTTIADFAESQNAVIGELQKVLVTVTASDEIDATDETDVYQRNDITLTAEVVPAMKDATMQPTGTVTFYYSVDGGATWTEITEHVALALNQVTGNMEAVLVTDILPVAAETSTKQDVVITAIYSGDSSFETSGTYDADQKTVTDTEVDGEDEPVVDDTVTVYSSVVYVNSDYENKQNFVTEDNYSKDQGIIATVIGDRFAANETATLKLQPVYTLDYADDTVGETIAKLTYSQDYTIQWQQLPNAGAYTAETIGTASGWQNLTGESNGTCRITVQQGYAYRAVITVKDADPVRASYEEFDQEIAGRQVYYSNIIMAGDGDLTLNVAVTTASSEANWEGIVQGEEVTFHTLMSGATGLTPIANVAITVKDEADETVFSDNENNVNGNVRFEWKPTVPGYYTVTVKATPTNGYDEKTITKEIIVRDNDYQIVVTGTSKTYNGSTLGVDVEIANMGIEAELADLSWTVTYTDEAGNLVEPTQAGTYTYVVTLPASAYWTEKTETGKFTIAKRQVSVVDLVAQAKVYDGTTDVNLLEIVLEDAATDSATGLPTGNTGVINGDSIYATGKGYVTAPNAGERTLRVETTTLSLQGDDKDNYKLPSVIDYNEQFTIQRNQLQGDIANATYQYTGSSITVPADDIYLIDQQGNVVTDYTVTYYYHNGEGVEKVAAMKDLGMYTIVVNKDPANYKGGASQTVYVSDTAVEDAPSKDYHSATIDITNTVELYQPSGLTGIQATASTGEDVTIEYHVGGNWTAAAPTTAGRYLVRVTTAHNDVAYGLYTIVKARPEVPLTVSEPTVVYDSTLHTGNPSTTSSGDGEVYYSYAGDVVIGYHGDVNVDYQGQHDVGTYVVTAHVGETANYTAHEVSKTFEITPKALTITADDLQRQQYGAYPDMVASYDGLATDDDKAVDTSLRDVMIQPEFSTNWNNFAQDHVGTYIITPVGYLTKNYAVTPVAGQYTVTATDPQPYLAIHGLPDNGTNTENIVYYDDVIQLYPYGNQVNDVVNGSSAIAWSVDNTSVADITQDGKLTIVGVGDFTITLTRGTGDEKISTTVSVTALKKEVKVIVPNEDVVYSGTEQTYSEDAFAVDAYKINETEPETSINLADTTRTEIGSQIVKGNVPETETLYQSETYGGKFTINDKEINIEPNEATTIYGSTATGLGYTEVTPVGGVAALTDGYAVSVADYYKNLDVLDGYEILVAGRENINYNVKYVTDQTAEDVQVTEKALTIKTGSYADTIGKTGGSLNPAGDYPVNGAIVDPAALFETDGMRMYGEPNQVMGFVLEMLIDGDSVADVNALLDWLVEFDIDDHHLIDEDANRYYSATGPTDNWINEGGRAEDYFISTEMEFRNYTENVIRGTQNIYQRPRHPEPDRRRDQAQRLLRHHHGGSDRRA